MKIKTYISLHDRLLVFVRATRIINKKDQTVYDIVMVKLHGVKIQTRLKIGPESRDRIYF